MIKKFHTIVSYQIEPNIFNFMIDTPWFNEFLDLLYPSDVIKDHRFFINSLSKSNQMMRNFLFFEEIFFAIMT